MHTRFVSFFLKYKFFIRISLKCYYKFRSLFDFFSFPKHVFTAALSKINWFDDHESPANIRSNFLLVPSFSDGPSNPRYTWAELRRSRFTQPSPEVSKGRKMRYQEHDQFIDSPEEKFCRKQTIAYLCCARILLHRHDHLRPSICPPIGCFSSILIKRWGNSASFSLPVQSQVQVLNKRLIDMRVYW